MGNYLVYFVEFKKESDDVEAVVKMVLTDYIGFNDKETTEKVAEKFKEKGVNCFILDLEEMVGKRNAQRLSSILE